MKGMHKQRFGFRRHHDVIEQVRDDVVDVRFVEEEVTHDVFEIVDVEGSIAMLQQLRLKQLTSSQERYTEDKQYD